jgi:hypothetical protein
MKDTRKGMSLPSATREGRDIPLRVSWCFHPSLVGKHLYTKNGW